MLAKTNLNIFGAEPVNSRIASLVVTTLTATRESGYTSHITVLGDRLNNEHWNILVCNYNIEHWNIEVCNYNIEHWNI